MKKTLLFISIILGFWQASHAATAAGHFKEILGRIQSIHTEFTQQQWPAGTAEPNVQQGQFLFRQPDKFHWIYHTPFKQEYIADGHTVRIYDEDLEQGIIREQGTFAQFIFSDLFNKDYPVELYYEVTETGDTTAQKTFVLVAKDTEHSPVQKILFILQNGLIESIDILDALNQRTLITLHHPEINIPVLESSFQFQWPEGTDVFDERNTHP